ncbi:MAG TPA: hypothetical protein VFT82_04390 [Candidatus Paceibacterota bacterium]|nr:hypothetical protein [Candidatus Paceibacterota bacterium]
MKPKKPKALVPFSPMCLGTSIEKAALEAIDYARNDVRRPVLLEFSGVHVLVGPKSNPSAVARRYAAQCRALGKPIRRTHTHTAEPATAKDMRKALGIKAAK